MRHQTPEQEAAENATAALVAQILGCGAQVRRRPGDWEGIDFELLGPDGQVRLHFEVKNRHNASTKYGDWQIDLKKVRDAQQLNAVTGKPVAFVARFTDRIALVDALRDPYTVKTMTRRQPRDAGDQNDATAAYDVVRINRWLA